MLRLPRFRFVEPPTVMDALGARFELGNDAMYVAGGTDLYPNMTRRQQTPASVISLAGISSLREIHSSPELGLRIGAGVTLSALAANPTVRRYYPAVATAAGLVSTPPLRNMGTIGGNLLLDTRCN